MSFYKVCSLLFIGFVLLPSIISSGRQWAKEGSILFISDGDDAETFPDLISAEIEMDYYFGDASLRTAKSMACKTDELIYECRMTCQSNHFGCIFDSCVCLDQDTEGTKDEDANRPSKRQISELLREFENLIDVPLKQTYLRQPEQEEPVERPALRHHIAHFCPNLDLARQCIRTCMKVGKPAFCGKDHRCYCGHKYTENDEDPDVDIDEVHSQYRDLYEKYFGIQNQLP